MAMAMAMAIVLDWLTIITTAVHWNSFGTNNVLTPLGGTDDYQPVFNDSGEVGNSDNNAVL
jgi:hypothetical protein